jgi:hypothetical protein
MSTVRPSPWSSGQNSWLQIQRSGFDSRRYQIFWEVMGLERSPLSLVSKTEELLGKNSSCFSLENLEYDRRDQSRWPRDTLFPQKLALTSLTSGGRSVGIVPSRTEPTECFCLLWVLFKYVISEMHYWNSLECCQSFYVCRYVHNSYCILHVLYRLQIEYKNLITTLQVNY